ncbi:hypothetical protein GW17_00000214 [Ensete ventricosum]|nr:hypothetical protein GW17_00000214 [Ensete ventricosum]
MSPMKGDLTIQRYDRSDWRVGLLQGGTSMESSIPCSHGGRALVVKGAEEVENTEANSKYQDMAGG